MYLVARAANQDPAFRRRIRGDGVVEHAMAHPASTVMAANDLFTFCTYAFRDDSSAFLAGFERATAHARAHPSLEDQGDRDGLLFLTAISWVSFARFSHPVLSVPVDSVPRFAWGRFNECDGSVVMPLRVQGYHAVMDGLHVGLYFQHLQNVAQEPDTYMASSN